MQDPVALKRDLVLVGGGHAHALVLRMLAMKPLAGLRISLVSPASHTPYSGMLPGLVAGHYSFEDTHIDLARLCQWAGVRFLSSEVVGLDPQQRRLDLKGRPPLFYDLVSLDIGSQPELASVPGALQYAVPVKPVAELWHRWQALEQRVTAPAGRSRRVAVVGGGAGSVELALAIAHRLAAAEPAVTLYCGAGAILEGYNRGARGAVERALGNAGVELRVQARVVRVESDHLRLADGDSVGYDELFWCTGACAAPWVAATGLPADERGFLLVSDTLQSLGDERVFAAGDIATQVEHPRPKAGVYAVRQGPVLAGNLRAALTGGRLREHRPQRRFLSLVSLGQRRATADRGPFSATGGWVWRWKDRIDRQFMRRFSDLPTAMPPATGGLATTEPDKGQMHCGGCGAKVGAGALARVLERLSRRYPQHCERQDLADDAAPVPMTPGHAVLQSVDVLRQLVADPWLMGRVAANHALSDLYACGARPVSALASLTLPFAGEALLERELEQLLDGALSEFAAVDCRLTGGHSLQGPELSVGFVVNGVSADGGSLLGKTGLRPGDRLVLSKPLGTGVLFAAHMQLLADGRDLAAAMDSMLRSNVGAAALALSHRASACTDVTGFGLAGHLLEMLGGELGAALELEALPSLPGALAALRAGIRSSMHEVNGHAATLVARPAGATEGARLDLLFDPQTSGGLLIGVAPERADALCAALREGGDREAAVIGEVLSGPAEGGPTLLLR